MQATVDGLPSNVARGKNLSFEISGEGSLPRVIVTEPKVRNNNGEPLLVFPRMYVGKSSSLQLVLKNEGTCPSKVNISSRYSSGPRKMLKAGFLQLQLYIKKYVYLFCIFKARD